MDRTRAMAERIASSAGLELVDTEWKGNSRGGTLRVFIDKPEGITHADCELVSHQLSAALDVEDLIASAYRLEVSSPGLDRKLSSRADFRRFAGRKATVRTRGALHGTRSVTGRLEGCSGEGVFLRAASGERLTIPLGDIEHARLVVEF